MLRLKIEFVPYPLVVRGHREKGDRRSHPTAASMNHPADRLHDSVAHLKQFRVFGGGVGPTRRGANMHLEAESLRYSTMPGYAWSPCAEHQKKRVPDGLLGALFPVVFLAPLLQTHCAVPDMLAPNVSLRGAKSRGTQDGNLGFCSIMCRIEIASPRSQ